MTEIDIREGEIVSLTNTDDSLNGWYEGLKADGKTRGYFPASYCQKIWSIFKYVRACKKIQLSDFTLAMLHISNKSQ